MHHPPRSLLLCALLISGGACEALAQYPAVSIEQTPPRIIRRTYDAQNPPKEMLRKLQLPEAGLCQSDFGCKILVGTSAPRFGPTTAEATTTSVRLVMHLDLTIWTAIEANAKLLAHEEGHREIWETYYREAHAMALDVAGRAIGTRLTIPLQHGWITGAVADKSRESLQVRLAEEFLQATAGRCIVANTLYDAITAHGTNAIDEAGAVAQAVAKERARPPPLQEPDR